jgi:hypothetical protein
MWRTRNVEDVECGGRRMQRTRNVEDMKCEGHCM